MNTLELQITTVQFESGCPQEVIAVRIDGTSLVSLVRSVEKPFAKREGHPKLAGAYAWLLRSDAAGTYLACGSAAADGRVPILQCTCGITSCWPLLARIVLLDTEVHWSDFEQPYRSRAAAAGHWCYERLGPFVFVRAQYERTVQSIA